LNKFLNINKKALILLLFLFCGIFAIAILFQKFNFQKSTNEIIDLNPSFDILNPTFTINNDKEKISVKAKQGNFIDKNLILLTNDVHFESDKFKILSDEVTFDREKQTAKSNKNSKFESNGTEIISQGFRLIEQGDIILFNGKTSVLLSQ
tara:strand:- start:3324 stop:3773 length:450 start_codon:yes stop_codon:yes gene_type:complete